MPAILMSVNRDVDKDPASTLQTMIDSAPPLCLPAEDISRLDNQGTNNGDSSQTLVSTKRPQPLPSQNRDNKDEVESQCRNKLSTGKASALSMNCLDDQLDGDGNITVVNHHDDRGP